MLKEAGCDDVRFGLESGSERVKKNVMNRPISNERVARAFGDAREAGLMTKQEQMHSENGKLTKKSADIRI